MRAMAHSNPERAISRYAAAIEASTITREDKRAMLTVFCSCLCRYQSRKHEIARLLVAGAKALNA